MSSHDSERACCVLGGCGFLGSVCAEHMLRSGWRVRVLDREGVDSWRLAPIRNQIQVMRGDLMNQGDLRAALEGMNAVLDFVGTTIPQSSMQDIAFDIRTNVLPTIRLLEQMSLLGIHRLVFASSGGTVYGPSAEEIPIGEDHPTNPICAYGISKLMVEKYIHLFAAGQGLRPAVLRFANPYGENQDPARPQGAVSVFLDKALKDEEVVIWGDGSVVRDYLYQEDLGRAVAQVMETPDMVGTFNVGSSQGRSLLDVIHAVEQVLNTPVKVRHVPGRPFDVSYNVLDGSRLQARTAWRPQVDLAEGIRRMVQSRRPRP